MNNDGCIIVEFVFKLLLNSLRRFKMYFLIGCDSGEDAWMKLSPLPTLYSVQVQMHMFPLAAQNSRIDRVKETLDGVHLSNAQLGNFKENNGHRLFG